MYSFIIEVVIINWLCSHVYVYMQLYVAIQHFFSKGISSINERNCVNGVWIH